MCKLSPIIKMANVLKPINPKIILKGDFIKKPMKSLEFSGGYLLLEAP